MIDAKSPFTSRHSERVAEIAVATATTLGFTDESLRDLRRAGLLHDIGKLAISNLILDKPGKLTVEEFEAVKRHPLVTEQILGRVSRFADIAGIAAAHHEKLDGSGYHRGIHGDELDPPARVLAVADIFEAMTADRPYRAADGGRAGPGAHAPGRRRCGSAPRHSRRSSGRRARSTAPRDS